MDKTINDVKVSRRHCQITQHDNGTYSIIDLGSSNGTYVNGYRVNGEERLEHGDVVRIGNTVLRWEEFFNPNNNRLRTISIGRGGKNDLNIANDYNVSRTHCQIVCYDDGTFAIEDLGSKNGTYVNDIRINKRTSLRHGDKVRVGNTLPSWGDYVDSGGTGIGLGTQTGTGLGTGTGIGNYEKHRENTEGTGIWTLLIGLASFGCVIYIIVSYFTSFGQELASTFGGVDATIKLFPIYLRGYFGIGGQWLPMIAAVILGTLTDLIDFLTGEKEDKMASLGQWLGNAGAVIGGIFILLALFAEKIVQLY